MKTIMIALREGSENGGPYNSHLRIMESRLKEKYRFVPLVVPKGRMGLLNTKILKSLVSQIKETQPDAVQIIGLEMIGFYLALACRITRVKNVIVAIHGSTTEAIDFNKNPLKKLLMERLEIFTLKTGTCTYGVSEYVHTIKNVAQYSKNYFGAIYNMIMADEVQAVQYDRNEVRKEFGIHNNVIVVMSTGRLMQEKGYDVLTDVIKHYAGDAKIVFLIAGDGDYKATMEEKLAAQIEQGQVKLLGYRSDVSRILTAGDIFVMPSYHETLCMSLLEAGQKGMALIASDVGGMREVIEDGRSGYLVAAGSPEAFIDKIEILRDSDRLSIMRKAANEIVCDKFSNDKATERLDQLYSSVLEE